jgi:AbiV family abortive infection protein
LAAFFATTTIEEVGKAVILGNRVLSGELDEKGFRNHRKKYACAVFETLSVNARVSRVYGGPEDKFATWFRDGELFDIRNSALYIDFGPDGAIVVPEQAVDKRDAYLLVCFGGDVLAEIQGGYVGTGPEEWKRLIDEIDAFGKENGLLLGESAS